MENKDLIQELKAKKFLTNEEFKTYENILGNKLLLTKEIDEKYKTEFSKSFENQFENFDGEKFNSYKNTQMEISNFGRVRIADKIEPQTDEKTGKGYLYLENWKDLQDNNGIKFDCEYIYEMVAEVFLNDEAFKKEKENNKKCTWDVHHINNDGYENTPENLIYLKRCQHKKVHHYMRFPESCKDCSIFKNWGNNVNIN